MGFLSRVTGSPYPGRAEKYEQIYGDRYSCAALYSKKLYAVFAGTCATYVTATKMPFCAPQAAEQLSLCG